jgi:hypothetical protein
LDADFGDSRTAGERRPSAAVHQAPGRCGAEGFVADLRENVQQHRPAFDSARTTAQGVAADGFYTVRSERLFCEQLDYNLLFRWFLDMGLDEPSFDHSGFSRNRTRLLKHDVAPEFFARIVEHAQDLGLMSDDHFTVDGTLIEAWASLKSFKPKDGSNDNPPDDPGNPTVNFHGERRSNATHESTTDPEARLARKGAGNEAKLCYSGNALMEKRNGLLVDFQIVEANGTAERRTAIEMVDQNLPGTSRITLGADKAYDTADFVTTCRALNVTPHVAANDRRPGGSALDGRTLRHRGTSSASKSASGSRRSSAGLRPWPTSGAPAIEAASSPSWQHTWSAPPII